MKVVEFQGLGFWGFRTSGLQGDRYGYRTQVCSASELKA